MRREIPARARPLFHFGRDDRFTHMKIDGSAIRAGMVLEYNTKLYLVVRHEIRTPGNLRAFNQIEMKDVVNGTKQNVRFNSGEMIERVSLEQRDYQYLYAEGDNLVFMDNENYEQITLSKELVGPDRLPFLQENMQVRIESHEGRPLSIQLPETVVLTIEEADPVVKGQTASSSYKPAKMENGVRVMVPPFIEAGTKIVVRVEDSSYIERAK